MFTTELPPTDALNSNASTLSLMASYHVWPICVANYRVHHIGMTSALCRCKMSVEITSLPFCVSVLTSL